eukprot:CAMPEP_0177713000 /NCGR_PEP_ID=MMETSP0484_2-20121128/12700_1 /TAXON_ID=354590 /ORGANISM="Rhodomonas lens, Strain RHODO" /LENGTH=268 /DNA_ID=CAMNT_0019224849 /DNA_START=87 /DNA_END=893 /DNA_ORIENTATION=-
MHKKLAALCKDDDKAQLVASVVRESMAEAGEESITRTATLEVLEQALLDFEVTLTEKNLNEILDELEEEGLFGGTSSEEDSDTPVDDGMDGSPAHMVGKRCMALMKMFDSERRAEVREWESGVVKEVEAGDEFGVGAKLHVLFDKFSALQVVSIEDVSLDDDEDQGASGVCPFCEREMPLTFHHLIPKCTHKTMKKKLGLGPKALNNGVDLCRPCHSAVHRTENNLTLAEKYNTTDKLLAHPAIQKWIGYAQKQKCEGNGQDGLRLRR